MLLTGLRWTLFNLIFVALSGTAHAVQSKKIDVKAQALPVQISLKVVQLLPSNWPEALIKTELQKVNLIYSQCGFQIKEIELFKIKFNPIFSDEMDAEVLADQISKLGIRRSKQITLVLSKGLGGDLKSLGKGAGGFSFPPASLGESSSRDRENLSIIFETVQSFEYKKKRKPVYSPIAHELGHVYLNSDHEVSENLMSGDPTLVNDKLTTSQCETIIRSPLLYN